MENETIKNVAKEMLKELLSECTDGQQLIFKRMYCDKNLELPINEAVDQMEDDKIDWAITQAERTVKKNRKELLTAVL
jgi:3-methyladenine DNA glycosylase AlkC